MKRSAPHTERRPQSRSNRAQPGRCGDVADAPRPQKRELIPPSLEQLAVFLDEVNHDPLFATISVTLDTYSHVKPKLQKEAAAKFDEKFGGLN